MPKIVIICAAGMPFDISDAIINSTICRIKFPSDPNARRRA
jgi:hypothetical protein